MHQIHELLSLISHSDAFLNLRLTIYDASHCAKCRFQGLTFQPALNDDITYHGTPSR